MVGVLCIFMVILLPTIEIFVVEFNHVLRLEKKLSKYIFLWKCRSYASKCRSSATKGWGNIPEGLQRLGDESDLQGRFSRVMLDDQ